MFSSLINDPVLIDQNNLSGYNFLEKSLESELYPNKPPTVYNQLVYIEKNP